MKQGIQARECSCNHAAEKHVPTLDARFMRCGDRNWNQDEVRYQPCECVIVRKEMKEKVS